LPSASADGLKSLEAKPTEEPAKPGTIIYPSAEADGKREAAAWGLLHLMRNLKGAGSIGNPRRAVRLYLRPKLVSVKRSDRSERPERLLSERSEFQTRQRTKGTE